MISMEISERRTRFISQLCMIHRNYIHKQQKQTTKKQNLRLLYSLTKHYYQIFRKTLIEDFMKW